MVGAEATKLWFFHIINLRNFPNYKNLQPILSEVRCPLLLRVIGRKKMAAEGMEEEAETKAEEAQGWKWRNKQDNHRNFRVSFKLTPVLVQKKLLINKGYVR